MGLFDQLLGGIVGQLGNPQQKDSLMNLATSVIQGQGGLNGLLAQLKSAGLGEHADSWVGTGANKPVTADQLGGALGSSNIAAMAQKLGINPQVAAAGLAALLPTIVDHLTPKGQVERGADLTAALNAIKSKMMA
ncbi:MAG TPA: YidB family protein [Thermoanaerobaculia bacterium]|nr:YidB family protein [Thermoanaerobaculia bacterium]